MRTSNRFLIALLILAIIAGSATGLGISPAKTYIDFEPLKEATVKLRILNDENRQLQVVMYGQGDNTTAISFDQNNIQMTNEEGEKVIYAKVKLPQRYLEPGNHEFSVMALEVSGAAGQTPEKTLLSATVAVESRVIVKVPYPSSYLEGNMFIGDAETGKPVSFTIVLDNLGTEDLTGIKAVINIYTPLNERVGRIETEATDIAKQRQGKLEMQWVANVNAGEYYAVATIYYGEHQFDLKGTFKVGQFEIAIERIEVPSFKLGDVARFNIFVENKWNKAVNGVYGEILINDMAGQQLTNFKTAGIDFKAGATEKLQAYWDTAGVSVGGYNMKTTLHYEGKETTQVTKLSVGLDAIQEVGSSPTGLVSGTPNTLKRDSILLLIVIILVLVNIGWFIYIKRMRKKDGQQ